MRIFTCIDFEGHYPVGTTAVVAATDATEARELLTAALNARGLVQDRPVTIVEMDVTTPRAYVLRDGDY